MNAILLTLACSVAGYLIGSIPFGWIIVKVVKGVDLRTIGSGRTGGTNVFRAAGRVPGFLTAFLDIFKGAITVLVVRNLFGAQTGGWAEALAGLGIVLGHNFSIFLGFKGGAGGATAIGTGAALWLVGTIPALLAGLFMLFIIGFASLATIFAAYGVAVALTAAALSGAMPVSYAVSGWGIVVLVMLALRPNIERLMNGTERRVEVFKRKPAPTEE